LDKLRQDLRFAARLLWKDRSFTATVVLTLALCIGANAAIFTVVRSVLMRPLGYPEPDRLLFSYDSFPGAGVERAGTSVPNYFERAAMTRVFESVALYRFQGVDVGQAGAAERVQSAEVTPSFFRVLRASVHRGRVFREEEGERGHGRVAIVSRGYGHRVFGDADPVGRDIRINGERHAIVGVLPDEFTFLDPDVRVWTPLTFSAQERSEESRWSQNHDQIARLASGVTLAQAQQQIDAQTARVTENAGPLKPLLINVKYATRLVPLEADMVRNVRTTLRLLWGGVLFVLLIAAANITNLVLVRASGRLKELATRHALGAGHVRMARQLFTETTLLTILGGLFGLAVGAVVLRWTTVLGLADLPRGHEVHMDWVVVAFTFGIALLLGLLIGMVPLAQLGALNLNLVLREDGRTGTTGRGTSLTRRSLVTVQIALAFILLIGAGLLLASFRQLLGVDPGFTAGHVLTGAVNAPSTRYPKDPALVDFANRTLERIRALPGVQAAGATSGLPFSGYSNSSVIIAEGYTMAPGESVISPAQNRVSPGYFEAIGAKLKRGRFFTDADRAGAPRVVIVDERLARKFWPNADPIGHRMYLPQQVDDVVKPGPTAIWLQVVGVVGEIKMHGLVEGGEEGRLGAYYFPFAQDPTRGIGFAIKTTQDPASVTSGVRQILSSLDPELSFHDVLAMPDRVERSLGPRRTPMTLALAFGAVALLLASIGIYGVLAYQVAQRTREIGIRMTLGSDTGRILRLILREGAMLVGIGLAVGLTGMIALQRVISSQLYGVGALDPRVMLGVSVVLILASFVACLGPARRAASVDPAVALAQR
jgi:putative ABC transport system permease protein